MTTTSYAILGLLAVKPWSTYELTQQMDRSLGRMWPRAQSKLYEEPKKLVEHGFATAATELVGKRPRTVYAITAQGRRALAAWLEEPGDGPVVEFEQLVKISFADQGTKADALSTLAATGAWARERNARNVEIGRAYLTGEGPFPDRVAQTMLAGAFFTEFYAMVARWAEWAAAQVEQWPDDPRAAVPDAAAMHDIVERASW